MADLPHDPDQPTAGAEAGEANGGPVIRDKRRIDPTTGALRHPEDAAAAAQPSYAEAGPAGDVRLPGTGATESAARIAELEASLAERTGDLQRLQAEYVNYRRRVERDRELVRDQAVAGVLMELLPVLDDLHLARQHGDLDDGPLKAIADNLETTLAKFGLERYGEVGDPFDPQIHEALMHSHSAEVTETTCVQVLQPGYRVGERVLRPARVAVADPE
jgi:molecular chaperone GrpE